MTMKPIQITNNARFTRLVVGATLLVGAAAPFSMALAVPAAPIEHRLTQPDGQSFLARQWGDEWTRGWETREGYAILRDDRSREWVYARRGPSGDLMTSWEVVGRQAPAQGTQRHLRPDRQLMEARRAERMGSLDGAAGLASRASLGASAIGGSANVLTILVNFSDRSPTYSPAAFDSLLFGTGTNSMKDFYQEASYGQFTVTAGPGGVGGWYQAASGHDYYGANVGGDDAWPGDLVYEAVRAADLAGFDFRPYDQNGDCYVDVANIVHQGDGEEASGLATDIWSHSWDLNSAKYYGASQYGAYTTRSLCANGRDSIKINKYVMQPETLWGGISTMGVFAHEYGHALGLPDLYDYGYDSQGVGDWSLMASGSWNGVSRSGDRPAQLEAWSKYRLGWVTPTQVTSATPFGVTLYPSTQYPDVYQFLNGNALTGTGEYFLVENRQKSGFDAALPAAGLLVWHVDEAVANNNSQCYPGGPSCATQHYKVALVQADNLWELEKDLDYGDGGDPFPGTSNRTALNDATSPNSRLYSGAASNISISGIAVSGANLVMTLALGATTPTLSSLAITGPNSLNEGTSATYTATATFSDGSTKTVTPTWSENSSYASITASGVLTAVSVSRNQTVTITASYSTGGITKSATKSVTIVNLVAKTLSSLTISGPSSVAENSSATFTATAKFSDGTTAPVTAIWSENSSYATISSTGVLTTGTVSRNQTVKITAKYSFGGVTKSTTKSVTILNQ